MASELSGTAFGLRVAWRLLLFRPQCPAAARALSPYHFVGGDTDGV